MRTYYKRRGMRAYSIRSHEEATVALERIRLKPTLLGAGGEASGLIFFRIPPGLVERWTAGFRLVVRRLPKVAGRDTLELVLDNARH